MTPNAGPPQEIDKPNPRTIVDDQTGVVFELEKETPVDIAMAWLSILYLLAVLVFLFWELFAVWIGHPLMPASLRSEGTARLSSPVFRMMAFTAIGGGLGGVATGIRSFISWHLERRAFGWRFVWKYITLPPLGALLAVLVYAILRAGVAALSGNVTLGDSPGSIPGMSALSIGAIAGYGSHKVFIWLDAQVAKLFSVSTAAATSTVPDLKGRTLEEARTALEGAKLSLGTTTDEPVEDTTKVGKIINQTPGAGSIYQEKHPVNVVVGIQKAKVPDPGGKTLKEAEPNLQKAAEPT